VSVNRGDLAKVVVSDSHMTDWVDDHALLAATMREVGNLALRYFRTDVNAWEKKGGTPVSDADLAVDRHLKQRLGAARPEYGWLSEETEDDTTRLTRRRVLFSTIRRPRNSMRRSLSAEPASMES
jgi:3'-phosphoadenosine 5'-phosphosulfate (PAPS) 3'-phosphatase